MSYRRGVYVQEVPTSLVPPVRTSTVVFAVGTAPQGPINDPQLIFSLDDFVNTFGWSDDYTAYTLCEVADVAFKKMGVSPVVFVNVFDPAVHKDANNNPNPNAVTSADIVGGFDPATNTRTGLELVEEVYPKFQIVPSILIAPKFSKDPTVALALSLKASLINSHFKALALADIDTKNVKPADAPSYVTSNNLRSPFLKLFYGRCLDGAKEYNPSTLSAFVYARNDYETGDFPFHSVSNKPLPITEVQPLIPLDQANYLAGQGITPVARTRRGLVAWGTRTTIYPASTDPKDTFDNVRRIFNYIGNELVLTFQQKVDFPITKRLIQSIVDSYNIRLNGLKAMEYILGGRVEFREQDNPATDLADGIIRFHVYLTPPSPAREINFILEYNAKYWENLQ